jgi:hypothetical protein
MFVTMRVEAVVVNHNTSPYAELAIRSLLSSDIPVGVSLACTVRDNHSTDDTSALLAACDDLGVEFEVSRWPVATKTVNTHGDVLRDFVRDRPGCDAYLFLDADIAFTRPAAFATMCGELGRFGDTWAMQARFSWDGESEMPLSSEWRDRSGPIRLASKRLSTADQPVEAPFQVHEGLTAPRCHPACALIRNDELFRRVADRVGFGCAWNWSENPDVGGFLDTMSLASEVMEVVGRRWRLSDAMVLHFFNVTYDEPERLASKGQRRDALLNRWRNAPSRTAQRQDLGNGGPPNAG